MRATPRTTFNIKPAAKPLRVGYVPLCDSAPLVMARELGLFQNYGLRVELTRELGWATVRDKIIHRELEAAHALAPMLFAAGLGLGSIPCDCVTGLLLSFEGNAVILSQSLREAWAHGGEGLRQFVFHRGSPLILAVPFFHSSHYFLLRRWISSHGLRLEKDVRVAAVPPPLMPSHLKIGHLDGYCVGEPWNAAALAEGTGWLAGASAGLAPWHPEKALITRRDFAEGRPEEHERLIAALLESCRFCAQRENRAELAEVMSQTDCLNVKPSVSQEGFARIGYPGPFDPEGYEPTQAKAEAVLEQMEESGLLTRSVESRRISAEGFRSDIFQRALKLTPQNEHTCCTH